MGLFYKELSQIYTAVLNDQELALPALPFTYGDYAQRQQATIQQGKLDDQLAYWKKQLANAPQLVSFPTDRPRPAMQTFNGTRRPVHISDHLFQRVKQFSRQQKVTPYMTLLATFQLLLHRYSGEDDISVGVAVANRTQLEIESLMGFFVNNLVMRTRFCENLTGAELVQKVRCTALEAYSNQDVPIEKVAEAVAERNLGHSALFQTMFILQEERQNELSLPHVAVTQGKIDGNASAVDITLSLKTSKTQLRGFVEYNTDLFNEATMQQLMQHFEHLLENLMTQPDRPVHALPLLTDREQKKILGEWNDTAVSYPKQNGLHQLFEAQTEQTPNHIAIEHQGVQISYTALNQKANQLSHYLQQLGVQPNDRVGLHVGRSTEQLIGFLAILKTGATLVPLDPSYPADRLSYYITDSQLSYLLTHSHWQHQLAVSESVTAVAIDQNPEQIAACSPKNGRVEINPDAIACIFYTSGSSGQPKGVMMRHRNLIHYTQAGLSRFNLRASDRVLQFATIGFDTIIEEVFSTLSCGATLVLRSDDMLDSVAHFMQLTHDWRLTVLDIPMAFWHEVTDLLETVTLPDCVRLIIVGGERALPDRLKVWQGHISAQVTLLNTYGPTEAAVVSSMAHLETAVVPPGAECAIGTPIANVQLLVLDKYRQPVPVGLPGELYIGGAGVAAGYWNQPEKTAAVFVQLQPSLTRFFSDAPTQFYKTGDLVQWRPDGNLTFVGRIDNQIKIRGVRVEPSEIEEALRQHTAVTDALVLPHKQENGETNLVAYFTTKQALSDSDLKVYLNKTLLPQMIPTHFVSLETLPLMPNGKVAIQSLPAPQDVQEKLTHQYTPPETETETETLLCQIWESCLNRQEIGIHISFFDAGGHSLLAMRIVAQIHKMTALNLTVRQLFEYPTIAQLAQLLDSMKNLTITLSEMQAVDDPQQDDSFEEGEI